MPLIPDWCCLVCAPPLTHRYCVDCDELYCGRCDELCHITLDASNHLKYDYPLQGAHKARYEYVKAQAEAKKEEEEAHQKQEEERARIAEQVCFQIKAS